MICHRCGSLMSRDRDGSHFCAACVEAEVGPSPGSGLAALERLEERIARLERMVATALNTLAALVDTLGRLTEAGPWPRRDPFLGSDPESEEPRRGEPGETR